MSIDISLPNNCVIYFLGSVVVATDDVENFLVIQPSQSRQQEQKNGQTMDDGKMRIAQQQSFGWGTPSAEKE